MNNTKKQTSNSYIVETQEEVLDTPLIPNHVYDGLPDLLAKGCDLFPPSSRERDVFLISSLTLISGCLPKAFVYYDEQKLNMNLYTMIVAPPASGKGVVTHAGTFIKEIESYLREKYNTGLLVSEAQSILDGDSQENDKSKNAKSKPPRKRLVIPANSSAASFIGILNENDGCGIIFETEADTLAQAFKQDWGNFSDTLRKAYHHEPVTISRKQDNAHIEINHPCISLLLAGTPQQVGSMGLSSPENGLQSRFFFYYYDNLPSFKILQGRKDNSRDLIKDEIGKGMLEIYMQLSYSSDGVELILSDAQWHFFSNWYKCKTEEICRQFNGYTTAMIRRIALGTIRIAGIITMLKEQEKVFLFSTSKVYCTWQTLRKAMAIADTILNHNLVIFRFSPMATPDVDMHSYMDFYTLLPKGEFKRKDIIEIASLVGFKERTIDRRLEKLRKSGRLVLIQAGVYKKK